MKRFISFMLITGLMLSNFCLTSFADEKIEEPVRYGYRIKTQTFVDKTNQVPQIYIKLSVPNYLGTLSLNLTTTEGSGETDVLVVYLPNNKWDNGSYYSAISGNIETETAKVYPYSDNLVKWKELYNYGFFPLNGGIYTADFNSVQMHFLQGPGLYTGIAGLYYSDENYGYITMQELLNQDASALKLTATGVPFILALDDDYIEYFLENQMLNETERFSWPGLKELLLSAQYELPSLEVSEAFGNFSQKRNYYAGIFLDIGINKSSWYDESVAQAYSLGLVEGYAGFFKPENNVTKAQLLALACRLHNIYNGGTGSFTTGPIWYSVYLNYALKNGIICEGDFELEALEEEATRAEAAYILGNALPKEALLKLNYIDEIPDVSRLDKYSEKIYRLYEAGILQGDENGFFHKDDFLTRAEAAVMLLRMAKREMRIGNLEN